MAFSIRHHLKQSNYSYFFVYSFDYISTFFYPSALRAGGVLSSRSGRPGGRAGGRAVGRAGGRLPDLRNPYLCNRLMDFLRSKFYGIV